MSVHAKLQTARSMLQAKEMTKSGHNKFAGYQYFELSDFLPHIVSIFKELGLCETISFTAETATLTLVDIEDNTALEITSPMADAQLKGCHPIQNLGAVETYQRRYLYVSLMDIVEHDALDSAEPVKKISESSKSIGKADYDKLDEAQKRMVDGIAEEIIQTYNGKGVADSYKVWESFKVDTADYEKKIEIHAATRGLLPSHIKTAFGKFYESTKDGAQ